MQTQLGAMFHHERTTPDRVWLTQPMGGGVVRELTFAQAMDQARRMAAHLRSLDLPPGSRIAILAKNNAWWLLADLAIWMAGHVTVPIYPTLTAASIRTILEHAEAHLCFIGKLDGFAAMEPGLPAATRRIVLPLGPAVTGPLERWEAIVAATAPLGGEPDRGPDELATICYTSGSTGEAKGVMHSFRTMCSARVFATVDPQRQLAPEDRMISYLPLAHVAERACLEIPAMFVGFHVFFAESLDTFVADLRRARPTVFGSVPRLWQKLQAGVSAKLPPSRLALLLRLPLVGTRVRRKVLEGLGLDQADAFITGSAPTPPDTYRFFQRLGIELCEIYGMTENFAVSHRSWPGHSGRGTVGLPLPGVQTRISEQGEVLIRSPGCMLGYYRAEALTRETIDEQGWLRTGDRGEVDALGALKLTGRVKELFKTSKGKYVAPAPIEGALLEHPSIDQAMVTGLGRPQPLALVVLSPAERAAADEPAARGRIVEALAAHLAVINARLDRHEQLEKLVVVGDEWTVENGLLTPTQKMRRAAIEGRYSAEVDAWAGRAGSVVWNSF